MIVLKGWSGMYWFHVCNNFMILKHVEAGGYWPTEDDDLNVLGCQRANELSKFSVVAIKLVNPIKMHKLRSFSDFRIRFSKADFISM